MALSAVITLSSPTLSYNAPGLAQVAISNSGDSPVTLKDLRPIIGSNTGVIQGQWGPPINPLVVPASGSVTETFALVPVSPQVVGPSTQPTTYSVGANLITSDGSSFAATPATLTVSPITAN